MKYIYKKKSREEKKTTTKLLEMHIRLHRKHNRETINERAIHTHTSR